MQNLGNLDNPAQSKPENMHIIPAVRSWCGKDGTGLYHDFEEQVALLVTKIMCLIVDLLFGLISAVESTS